MTDASLQIRSPSRSISTQQIPRPSTLNTFFTPWLTSLITPNPEPDNSHPQIQEGGNLPKMPRAFCITSMILISGSSLISISIFRFTSYALASYTFRSSLLTSLYFLPQCQNFILNDYNIMEPHSCFPTLPTSPSSWPILLEPLSQIV